MSTIRECDAHGYFDGSACPACGDPGREVLDAERRTRLSKFVSGALRHFPDDAGLSMDRSGWVDYGDLVAAVTDRYGWADPEHVAAVIGTDPKGRFERRDDRVRAAYGHSIDVDLGTPETPVPNRLYHGTAPERLGSIMEEGLCPMGRNEVHLSGTVEDARAVGSRHAAEPVVLEIDARRMRDDGHEIARRGPETYTTPAVPPGYIAVLGGRP